VAGGAAAALLVLAEQLAARPQLETIEALGWLGDPDAAPLLAPAEIARVRRQRSETGEWWVAVVTEALGRSGGDAARAPLHALMQAGDEDALHAAAALSRLGDPAGTAFLREAVADWDGAPWGIEPPGAKWEAVRRLGAIGDEAAAELQRRWYRTDPTIRPGSWPRQPADRWRWLQEIGRSGDAGDLPFLRWVAAHDRDASEKGWALGREAERALRRISWREARRGYGVMRENGRLRHPPSRACFAGTLSLSRRAGLRHCRNGGARVGQRSPI
jgi:HEAT repeat protein